MKPLNKKERNKAWFRVVGLFLICFVISLILGFTTMNVKKITDYKTAGELEKLKSHLKFQEEVFAPNVGDITEKLSNIPNYKEEGLNLNTFNNDIGVLISNTKNQAVQDDSWESKMYNDVMQAMSDLQVAYNEQINLAGRVDDSNSLDQKLQQCERERDRLQNQVNMLSGSGGGSSNCEQCLKDLKEARTELTLVKNENKALKSEIDKIRK
ncbi:MAG: hypothetical protein JW833_17795 [Prolixibacteraceae bacterium]|nr:hypothetical protein [Prolixibacteraceae bacterium]